MLPPVKIILPSINTSECIFYIKFRSNHNKTRISQIDIPKFPVTTSRTAQGEDEDGRN